MRATERRDDLRIHRAVLRAEVLRLHRPQLSCRVEGDEIIVSAKAYAKSVEVLNENEDWVLEDNYFDLEAGEERRIRIVSGDANGIHMRSVYNIR